MKPPPSLADRKRQLVVDELTEAALQTLAIKGFDATTVDEIAAAAGVSRRTFFRYFASKEDVVVQLLASIGEVMCAELAARPADETPAVALRHAVAAALADCAGPPSTGGRYGGHAEKALRVVKMVTVTPPLLARFLERQAQWQDDLAGQLAARYPGDDLFAALAAGLALNALHVVVKRWALSDGAEDAEALLDRAFRQLSPALTR